MASNRALGGLLIVALVGLVGCATPMYRPAPRVPALGMVEQADADFDSALALVAELRYDRAAEQFSALAPAFDAAGKRSRAAESLFWMAYCYEKEGRADLAVEGYGRVSREYPNTPAAQQAADRAARLKDRAVP